MAYNANGACVKVRFLVMGPIENNVYFIDDGQAVFVVDPTCDAARIVGELGGRVPEAIVLTHAHWDHVGAAAALREATGARVVASAVDAPFITGERKLDPSHRPFPPCPVDLAVADGDEIAIGTMTWKVLLTPGHTPGSMCLFGDPARRAGACEDPGGRPGPGAPVLVAGDTLFAGAHGRTDFVGGDPVAMRRSLQRLAELSDATIVLPGHNATTTIGREKLWIAHR